MPDETAQHTPRTRTRHDDGSTLSVFYVKRGSFRFGHEVVAWIWGSKRPGYGVVADCSPHDPAVYETIAYQRIMNVAYELTAALEAGSTELRSIDGANGEVCTPVTYTQSTAGQDAAVESSSSTADPAAWAGQAHHDCPLVEATQ